MFIAANVKALNPRKRDNLIRKCVIASYSCSAKERKLVSVVTRVRTVLCLEGEKLQLFIR